MAESFLGLSATDKRELLALVASRSGRPAHILEKDIWVVWTLNALFSSSAAENLVFKGGTSLSKAYKAIERFSEDIDITYSIRAIAPDLVQGAGEEALPPTSSQVKKWTGVINERLPAWVATTGCPIINTKLVESALPAEVTSDKANLYINYEPSASGYGYVAPRVFVEFGARSTGEPANKVDINCDAAAFHQDVSFPTARPRAMAVERTFWEKVTAIHVFCLQGSVQGRLSRHWYDIAKLEMTGYAKHAFARLDIADAVIRHKDKFFRENDAQGNRINYFEVLKGNLKLVPTGKTLTALEADYEQMRSDGLLPATAETFAEIIDRCKQIQKSINAQIT